MKNKYIQDHLDKEFDFYYSEQQAKNTGNVHTLNGKRFTAASPKGVDHGCNYIDMQLIGTGTYRQVSMQKNKAQNNRRSFY